MSASALICLVPGNEETEVVTTVDLLIRDGIKVTITSVTSDGNLAITYSCGMKLLADTPLVEVADDEYDVIVLPGGIKDAECFRNSTLSVETARQFRRSGRVITIICATPATMLVPHDISPIGSMTGFPVLKDKVPAEQQLGKCVIWDAWVGLSTGQGPGTAIDFGLKIIDLLIGCGEVHEVASQLVTAARIYNYYEQCQVRQTSHLTRCDVKTTNYGQYTFTLLKPCSRR